MKLEAKVVSPLKWPDGWERARIEARKNQSAWKNNAAQYRESLVKELARMGAAEVLITHNGPGTDRLDPGVAVYFSMQLQEDYSWQEALELDTPAPTLEQIDAAYKRKALPHHPDRGGDAETFRMYTRHRDNAKAWVLGTQKQEHEYVIPCDRFKEVRWNLAAIKLAVAALRSLDRVGIPGMLQRSFKGFRTALPVHATTASEEKAR